MEIGKIMEIYHTYHCQPVRFWQEYLSSNAVRRSNEIFLKTFNWPADNVNILLLLNNKRQSYLIG